MKDRALFACRGTYIVLFVGLFLIASSLGVIAFYLYYPPLFDSEAHRWLVLHFAYSFDTIAASMFMTLCGAFLLEYTYRKTTKQK